MSKIMIITGGFRGIGFATAQKCLQEGHKVVLVDKDSDYESVVQQKLSNYQNYFLTIVCDITDENSVAKMVEAVFKVFGEVTTVINNAGIFINNRADNVTEDAFNQVMDVNVWGVYWFLSMPFHI